MKRLLILSFIAFSLSVSAQIESRPSAASHIDDARFEIVQSPISRQFTFLLDKFTGEVKMRFEYEEGKYYWKNLIVIPLEYDNLKNTDKNRVNYQLYCGGISVQDIFLLNVRTGTTWVLYRDPTEDVYFFGLIK